MTTLLSEKIRAFIAVRPGSKAQGELARVQRELRKSLSVSNLRVKWSNPETFHVTLLFLGDIPAVDVPPVFQTLEKTAAEFPQFGISLGPPGIFKKSGAFWVGICPSPELVECQKALAEALEREPGRFHAHFTLGRIKTGRANQAFLRILEQTAVESIPFKIGSVELVQSELMSDGARHTVLGTAEFA